MRQFRIVDVRADSASVVGDQFREFVEAVERNNKKTKSVNEVIVGVGVVRRRGGGGGRRGRGQGQGHTSAR